MGQEQHEDEAIYCADLVKAARSERYLSLQFANPSLRQKLLAIAAFEIELSHIADHVSDPHLGQMRLQFWREGVEEIAQGAPPRAHPVMQGLAEAFGGQASLLAGADVNAGLESLFGALAESYFLDTPWNIDQALDHFTKIETPFLSLSLSLVTGEDVLAGDKALDRNRLLQKAARARAIKSYLLHLIAPSQNGLATKFCASLPSGPEDIAALQQEWNNLRPGLSGAPSKLMPVLAELSHITPWLAQALAQAARHGAGKGGLTTHPAKLFWTVFTGRF
jgi:squalene/phytoene synthase